MKTSVGRKFPFFAEIPEIGPYYQSLINSDPGKGDEWRERGFGAKIKMRQFPSKWITFLPNDPKREEKMQEIRVFGPFFAFFGISGQIRVFRVFRLFAEIAPFSTLWISV